MVDTVYNVTSAFTVHFSFFCLGEFKIFSTVHHMCGGSAPNRAGAFRPCSYSSSVATPRAEKKIMGEKSTVS
jgi:hypothetical protein